MTQREFYEAIVNGNITEEVVAMAQNGLDGLDKANSAAKAKRAAANETKMAERAPQIEALVAVVGAEPQTMPQLIAAAGLEISTVLGHKFLAPYVEAGTMVKTEVKGEKGKVKAYALA